MTEIVDFNDLKEQQKIQVIDKLLSTLPPRDERCLRMHFGIGTGKPQTLEEIAKTFNVEPYRVRQVIAKALRKMCHPSRVKVLQEIGYDSFEAYLKELYN